MNYRAWQLKNADTAGESALLAAGYGPLLARVLACRGIAQPQAAAALLEEEPPLSDPFLLKDMDKAVARIQQAIENGETIVIFGDYDVDGVSATAILYECLTNLGAQVRCKLPTREGGGYGLNRETLQKLADKGYKLIVTVDNGISAIEEADLAAELGIELVITDHHLPAQQLPKAVAVVDPKREDDTSPFKDLCGAGVAFKLCAALEGCEDPAELLEPFGELAALGTIADVMPLVGENRTIVREGLSLLQDTMRPGLHALLESAGCGGKPVTADTVSYSLAPRLNAAGRMDNAAVALKLLLCGDEDQATGIAERLAEINTERQQTEQQVFAAALQALEADPARTRDRVLVVSGEDWHPGVIGIVAARLMERFSRPVIVISMHEGEGRGSGRAPDPFDLHSALADCAQYLTRFGGHAAAAGVEIEEENLAAFRQTINAWAAAHAAPPEAVSLRLDAAATLGDLNLENVGELARLAPFGRENPTPVLLVQHAFVDGIWPMGAEGRHTRIRLRQGSDTLFASSGMNINNNAGSTHIEGLQKFVVEKGLDIGFAYDGDADRCLCVDEKGNVITGDHILYIYGCYMKERGKLLTNTVVTTVMSNFGLYKAFDEQGIDYAKTAVGDKYVYEYMAKNGCRIGGEQSGHIIFSKYASTGDGILTSLKMMEVMLAKKMPMSKLAEPLKIYPQVLEDRKSVV